MQDIRHEQGVRSLVKVGMSVLQVCEMTQDERISLLIIS